MGEVYRALDTRLQREVAIKVLPDAVAGDAERLMRFEREARVLATLNHPHIAHIYGLEEFAGEGRAHHALIMELVAGETLADRLARGALPLDETLAIARQVTDALQASHDAGVVHRDLKPANVKIRSDGTVKVLDFGLAKLTEAPNNDGQHASMSPTITSPAMTRAGLILGTAAYMSPEQARGTLVDRRTDVWAFGCVLFEMLTGRLAFPGETISDTIAAILARDPDYGQLPANTPSAVHRVLRRCLSRDPRARLHHIADARLDLDEAQSGSSAVAAVPAPSRRQSVVAMAAAVLGAALAGALVVYLATRATAPPAAPRLPMRLALAGVPLNGSSNGLLISPDSRYVVAIGPSGISTLHPLDGSPSRALGGQALCWFPDGRRIVMMRAKGELLRIDVAGGPAVAFAHVPDWANSCSWNSSGTLIVDGPDSFSQVPASGGATAKVELDDGGGEGMLRLQPQFLPDGRHFLYWAVTPDGKKTIRAASLDSRQSTPVVPSDAPGIYSGGYLLFHQGANLFAQRFDARALQVTGEPQALTSEAIPGAVTLLPVFAASDSTLVFTTTNGGIHGEQVWVDRKGNVIGKLPPFDRTELLNVALTPDGTRVAGTRMDPATGNWDIWIVDLRSGVPTRVTTNPAKEYDVVWSPDGTEIAFASERPDAPGLYRRSLVDGREQLLLKIPAMFDNGMAGFRPTDWTRDGRYILYDWKEDVHALPVAPAAEPIKLASTPGLEGSGRVSPDGRWLAFLASETPGDDHIYVQPFPGPGARTRVSTAVARHPRWRRDGRELIWMEVAAVGNTTTRKLASVTLAFDGAIVRADPPALVLPPNLTIASLVDSRPHFTMAPDAQRFLIRQSDGDPRPAVQVIFNWQDQLTGLR